MTFVLNIAIPGAWNTLIPPLQHTAYAGTILSNVFEPLVERGPNNTYVPNIAKSWKITPDFKMIEFQIDEERRFSDGTQLTAEIIKQSWLHGLKLNPISSNKATLDVLSSVEGIDDYEKTGAVSGFEVVSSGILRIHLKKPFRMLLQQLTSEYMAPFIIKDGKYLGTGPYVIDSETPSKIQLSPNKFSKKFNRDSISQIQIFYVPVEKIPAEIESGKVDLVMFGQKVIFPACSVSDSRFKCHEGQESTHMVVTLNAIKNRLFNDPDLRRAIQYVIINGIRSQDLPSNLQSPFFNLDQQTILPLQAGRLSDPEATKEIQRGKDAVSQLQLATINKPLLIKHSEPIDWLFQILTRAKINYDAKNVTVEERLNDYYKTNEADMLFNGFSVNNADPDGLYHALGRHGAIASPILMRKTTQELLEKGRELLDSELLDAHYLKVNKSILDEVPWVHLGIANDTTIYNSNVIFFPEDALVRHELRFHEIRRVD